MRKQLQGKYLLVLLVLFALLMASGCTGPQVKGDRAMMLEDYARAMAYYEAAMDDGNRDPDLYYNAARAAQRQGAFGKAERYFSQSLRYGGGVEVARSLAEFYIQTSNFNQAVNVFHYLLRIEEDVQPLYSNIGTALMYGGNYLDAETYLLLAQQMEPADPVPYINLGVLYDRHLRNWPRAVRFYECYVEMSHDQAQARTVTRRLQEMANTRAVDTSRVGLECGQEYQAKEPEKHNLREVFEIVEPDQQPHDGGQDVEVDGLNLDLPLVYEPVDGGEQEEEQFDGPIEIVHREGSEDESRDLEDEATVAQARESFEAGRYDQAVELLGDLEEEERSTEETALLGKALYQVGRFEEAARHLEGVIEERPSPERALRLLQAYERLDDEEGAGRVCDRFAEWPDYEEALRRCEEGFTDEP